jgi:hypothetical protein
MSGEEGKSGEGSEPITIRIRDQVGVYDLQGI